MRERRGGQLPSSPSLTSPHADPTTCAPIGGRSIASRGRCLARPTRWALRLMATRFNPRSFASTALSTVETFGLAGTATLASAVWLGAVMPDLPWMPGFRDSHDNSVAIALDNARLGISDRGSRLFIRGASPRQARLFALLLPQRDPAL